MKYQIDQSGKIEQTNLHTIIALSNGKKFTVLLKKNDKRIIEKVYGERGNSRSYISLVFAALLAIAIVSYNKNIHVTVDKEYTGHEQIIKERCITYIHRLNKDLKITIEFGHVGKLSNAHSLAAKVSRNKQIPDKIVTLSEVLELTLDIKKSGVRTDRGKLNVGLDT